MCYFA